MLKQIFRKIILGIMQRLYWGRKGKMKKIKKVGGQLRAIQEPRRKSLRAVEIGWGLWELKGEDRCESYLYGAIRLQCEGGRDNWEARTQPNF